MEGEQDEMPRLKQTSAPRALNKKAQRNMCRMDTADVHWPFPGFIGEGKTATPCDVLAGLPDPLEKLCPHSLTRLPAALTHVSGHLILG